MSHRQPYVRDAVRENQIAQRLRHLEQEVGILHPKKDVAARLFEFVRSPGYAIIFSNKRRVAELWEVVIETAIKAQLLNQITEFQKDKILEEATPAAYRRAKPPPPPPKQKQQKRARASYYSTNYARDTYHAPPRGGDAGWGWSKDTTDRPPPPRDEPPPSSSRHRTPYVENLDKRRDRAMRFLQAALRLVLSKDRGEAQNAKARAEELSRNYGLSLEEVFRNDDYFRGTSWSDFLRVWESV